jgi:hypothetical protein
MVPEAAVFVVAAETKDWAIEESMLELWSEDEEEG